MLSPAMDATAFVCMTDCWREGWSKLPSIALLIDMLLKYILLEVCMTYFPNRCRTLPA